MWCVQMWSHSTYMYSPNTCTMAVWSMSCLSPMAMEDADITRGPHRKRMTMPITALLVPQAMIRGWRAMKSPAHLAMCICHSFHKLIYHSKICTHLHSINSPSFYMFHFPSNIMCYRGISHLFYLVAKNTLVHDNSCV